MKTRKTCKTDSGSQKHEIECGKASSSSKITHIERNWFLKSDQNLVQVREREASSPLLFENKRFKESVFFTLDDVADRLKVSKKCLYEHIAEGKLKAVKVGRVYRVEQREVEAWLTSQNGGQ